MRVRDLVVAASALCLAVAGTVTAPAGADVDAAEPSFWALDEPRRVLDTRAGEGARETDSTLELAIAGRVGVPADAAAVAVNITAVEAAGAGFVTAFPCGQDRPNASSLNVGEGGTIAVGALAPLGPDGELCLYTSVGMHLLVDVVGYVPEGGIDALAAPQRLLDTREGAATVDGEFEGIGERQAGSTLELDIGDRAGLPGDPEPAVLTVTAVAGDEAGHVTVHPCDGARPTASSLNHAAGQTVANTVVSRVDAGGRICLYTSAPTHLIVDVTATLPAHTYATLEQPRRLLDTRSPDSTVDGRFAGGGVRPHASTLELDVAGRGGVPADAGAVMLNVTVVDAVRPGFATVHPAGTDRPDASNLNVGSGGTVANAVVARVGVGGAVCLHADAAAHYVVDVVGWMPGAAVVGDAAGDVACPSPPLFPTYRMVALYGTDSSDQMGALGEQPPEQAAARLAEVMAPFEQGDRPVLGVFELIATIATVAPGPDGQYRSVSTPEHVQRYLDVAREHGYYLLLDIQPGRSDFLTEVQRYDEFLRQPDVGVALDPEWRMGPGEVPGELVGQVSAAEVNQVADYLAGIVADEGLPQKLMVVHQFQDRMITDRDDLIAPPELAVNIHMDGFGTREQKLDTYGVTQVDLPFWNGFKLFYDEDIDMFSPADVLALDPVPDFVSYQ